MRRAGKIFPAHGGEIANKLLHAVEREGLVERLVDSYVDAYDRRTLKASAAQYRELLATIGREVLLVMVARVRATLPRYLNPRPRQSGRRPQASGGAPTAESLSQELLASLSRALPWTAEDEAEFRRDLALYAQLAQPGAVKAQRRGSKSAMEGPFADRCALLLDPSMLDNARLAASRFLLEVERRTDTIVAGVLRRRR